MFSNSFLKANVGNSEIRLAFPHLSPKPFIVPWTCLAPALTAARVLATALPVSLCAWIPRWSPEISLETFDTISSTSCGRVPPFVSQRTSHRAPFDFAALRHSIA